MSKALASLVSGGKKVGHSIEKATHSRWIKAITRYGYFARGLVFIAVGFLALQVAWSGIGAPTDQTGALTAIAGQPFGQLLLVVIAGGLIGFALWGFIRAIFDPLERGRDKQALVERFGFALSGMSYSALVLPTIRLILGAQSAEHKTQTQANQDVTAQLLAQPLGVLLVVVLGLLVLGWSLAQLWVAYRGSFQKDFKLNQMDARERQWTLFIGRIGIGARALVFALTGVFFIQAAIQVDPRQVIGLDGALLKIAQEPEGTFLLIAAAAGLITFGVYSMLAARWLKVA